jgi:hypothetical protein
MIQLMLKNTRLGLLMLVNEIERYRNYARRTLNSSTCASKKSTGQRLVKKMVFGPWDDEFL